MTEQRNTSQHLFLGIKFQVFDFQFGQKQRTAEFIWPSVCRSSKQECCRSLYLCLCLCYCLCGFVFVTLSLCYCLCVIVFVIVDLLLAPADRNVDGCGVCKKAGIQSCPSYLGHFLQIGPFTKFAHFLFYLERDFAIGWIGHLQIRAKRSSPNGLCQKVHSLENRCLLVFLFLLRRETQTWCFIFEKPRPCGHIGQLPAPCQAEFCNVIYGSGDWPDWGPLSRGYE